MAGIKDYSTTQASNTDLNGISTAEGMLPSNLNNAIRALMKNTREWFNDSQWVEYGDGSGAYTAAYASSGSFTIAGVNVTSFYHAGRRIKLIAATPGTIFGTIISSSFSTNTTVNVTWDSGSLSSEAITNVFVGALSKTNDSIPTGISATKIANGTISDTEFQYLNGVSSAIQTQLDAKNATITGSASTIDTESLTASRAVISNGSQKIAVSDVTSTELGYLDGVTSAVQTQIDSKQATITGAATTIDTENLTASRALTSNGSGKVEVSAVTSTELGYLDGVSSSIQTQIDAKGASNANLTAIGDLAKTDGNLIVGNGSTWVAENGATARTSLGLGSIATQAANNVSISGGSVTGLGEPSSNSDASTKSYVDQAVAGLRTRTIAECASTANVNISNALEAGDAIDGVTLVAGDRVLLKDQSTATENGLYLAVGSGAGAASRDPEHDSIAELSGGMVVVNQGSVNDNKIFLCTTDNTGSVGSTSITYTVITPSNSGTVTSIATGTGIDGGTITSTGTIAIDSTVATLTGTQTLTNKTITAPKIGTSILDTNGNELALLTATGSAVNEFTVANAAASGSPTLSATGGDSNIDLDLLAKGTGHVTVRGNTNPGALQLNCENNTHGQIVKAQPHSAAVTNISLLPAGASSTLVSLVSTDTLTNKTLTSPKINEDVAVTSTATEINRLDALSRGSLIYGNASAATAILTKGSANQILTSDGTDISWSDAAGGGTSWQSAVKTSNFTAAAGEGYFINTAGGAFEVDLPGSPSVGDQIEFVDFTRNFATAALTLDQGSLKFQGTVASTTKPVYDISGQSINIVYSGSTQGWIPTSDDDVTLKTSATWTIDYLVVAGGGGGGKNNAGGGGAGGMRTGSYTSVSASTAFTTTIGAGGAGATGTHGTKGSDSTIAAPGFTTITSTGGGHGSVGSTAGGNGGSGGGGGYDDGGPGLGNYPATHPSQGADGGQTFGNTGGPAHGTGGGGGGGENGVRGEIGITTKAGDGGDGTQSSITGSAVYYAGGGGGAANNNTASCGDGGQGGGGNGAKSESDAFADGTANTGGGGGGHMSPPSRAGNGGSGVIILSVPTAKYSGTTSGSPTITTSGANTIIKFTGSGSYTS